MIKTKKCIGPCEQELELNASNFNKRSDTKDGFTNQCKKCVGLGTQFTPTEENGILFKKCTKCEDKKELNTINFTFRQKRNSWESRCKICISLDLKEFRKENKEEINKKRRDRFKNDEEFKNRMELSAKVSAIKNKEKIAVYKKKWAEENKEKTIISKQRHRANPENKRIRNERERIRLQADPVYRLKCNTSRTIRNALKFKNFQNKGKTTLNHLPYTIEELKLHIESLWEPWMNWGNWGLYNKNRKTWQIDHIIAQTKLPFDSLDHPNFLKCWDLSNLQPLETIKNIKKGNRVMENINA